MKAVFSQAHRAELGPTTQIAVWFRTNMGVNDFTVFGHSDHEMLEVTRTVEKFPMHLLAIGMRGEDEQLKQRLAWKVVVEARQAVIQQAILCLL